MSELVFMGLFLMVVFVLELMFLASVTRPSPKCPHCESTRTTKNPTSQIYNYICSGCGKSFKHE